MRRLMLQSAIVLALAIPTRADWKTNECVQCHQREVLPVTLGHSFPDWQASIHARGGVGCEKCHGGDPAATAQEAAHRGVRPAGDPASLVHPTHLPETCGKCHPQELAAFRETVHARELATKGSGATCFTCHEAMATSLPTSRELAARCAVCHDRPVDVQTALSMMAMTKTKLYRTRRVLDAARTANPEWHREGMRRFHTLESDYVGIQKTWHTFETDTVIREARDLLKLTNALADEADVMTRRGTK